MFRYIILLSQDPLSFIRLGSDDFTPVYAGTIKAEDEEDALNRLFCIFNRDYPQDYRGRSLSVGDRILLDGERIMTYQIEPTGFTIVNSN